LGLFAFSLFDSVQYRPSPHPFSIFSPFISDLNDHDDYDDDHDDDDYEDDDDYHNDDDDDEEVEVVGRTFAGYSNCLRARCTGTDGRGSGCRFVRTVADGKMSACLFRKLSSKTCIACQRRSRSDQRLKARSGKPTLSFEIDDITSEELLHEEKISSQQVKDFMAIVAALQTSSYHAAKHKDDSVGCDDEDEDDDDDDDDDDDADDDDAQNGDLPRAAGLYQGDTNHLNAKCMYAGCRFASTVKNNKMPSCLFRGPFYKNCISCQRLIRSQKRQSRGRGTKISCEIGDLTENELLQENLPPKQVGEILAIVATLLKSSSSAVANALPALATTASHSRARGRADMGKNLAKFTLAQLNQEAEMDEQYQAEKTKSFATAVRAGSSLGVFTEQQKQTILQRTSQGKSQAWV
jgi:hypothetical protein